MLGKEAGRTRLCESFEVQNHRWGSAVMELRLGLGIALKKNQVVCAVG